MLALKVEIAGQQPLIAGVEEWSVLAAHVNALRGASGAPTADSFDFSIGGLTTQNADGIAHHFRWPRIPLGIGSTVAITLIETDTPHTPAKLYRSDHEVKESPFTAEELREMRLQDYLELKKEFGNEVLPTAHLIEMSPGELFLKGDELYENGNFEEAFSAFLMAAEQGDTSCMTRVASMYTCGEGVSCDFDKAIEWELKAIEGGETSALVNLGISYRMKGNLKKARYWFEKAIEAGDGCGALELAKLYMVTPKESERAGSYLCLAIANNNMCEADIEEAQELLAELQSY